MMPPTTYMPARCRCDRSRESVALPVRRPPSRCAFLAARLEELEVVVEHVLDPEEDVAEPGRAHQRRQRLAVVRDRRGHRLDDVVDVVAARRR